MTLFTQPKTTPSFFSYPQVKIGFGYNAFSLNKHTFLIEKLPDAGISSHQKNLGYLSESRNSENGQNNHLTKTRQSQMKPMRTAHIPCVMQRSQLCFAADFCSCSVPLIEKALFSDVQHAHAKGTKGTEKEEDKMRESVAETVSEKQHTDVFVPSPVQLPVWIPQILCHSCNQTFYKSTCTLTGRRWIVHC